MVAHVDQPIRSQGFIKVYLLIWGLLALGALGYLAALAFPTQQHPRPQTSEPDQGIRAVTRALANVDSIQREMRRDLNQLKDTVAEREVQEKATTARLTGLEERVATWETTYQAAAAAPAAAKSKAADKAPRKAPEPRAQARVTSAGAEGTPGAAPAGGAESPPLETGSIVTTQPPIIRPPGAPSQAVGPQQVATSQPAAPQATITFGDPVVTASAPQGGVFAVQIAAGPSLSALKLSWGILMERHGTALAPLQPRVVAPKTEGGPYRLLAGPLPNRADAERVCEEMRVGRSGCFATAYVGDPL